MNILPYLEGHSKTVYSLVWPETEQVVRRALSDVERLLERHRRPHLKQQDAIGPDFAAIWWEWSGIASGTVHQWDHFYPTAGASEAIREVIDELAAKKGRLIVFEGEYEGYGAIAQGANTPIHVINRSRWKEQWDALQTSMDKDGGYAQWWISEPSAINGCVWDEFDEFITTVGADERVEIWVDATYIGATVSPRAYNTISSKYVTGVVFSLSKPFGVYYRRIGGCFCRRAVKNLWGNMWFKNIDSIELGKLLLTDQSNHTLAEKYQVEQTNVLKQWNNGQSNIWHASDVVILAYASVRPDVEVDDRYRRGEFYRVCLTPAMHKIINGV